MNHETDYSNSYEYCVYTIRNSQELASISKHSYTITEKKRWISAEKMLKLAKAQNQKFQVIFAAAENIEGVIYCADIDELEISDEDKGSTKISFSNLRPVKPKIPLKNLILRSTNKSLSDNFIRSYAICLNPLKSKTESSQ